MYTGPHPIRGSVHNTPWWHHRSKKASQLSHGSLPRSHADTEPPALRSPPSTNSQALLENGSDVRQDAR